MSTVLLRPYAVDTATGEAVADGHRLTDAHGNRWTFLHVRASGRVLVCRTCPDIHTQVGECTHPWHMDGIETAEFPPVALGLEIR